MKPIKLVIKGLNSFIEEQIIDFNKLTDRGLFGIFGPTGSGKSTILDGITLALYGDIARKSSNFINTNCNDLNVSFKFQISGVPNRVYVVSRHFKRDKKTGNAKTHSAVVKEIIDGKEEVLAESVKQVNDTCKSILGLSLDDFTRTVVLPQGKFSEFLKLEGKQRREMLERLFNLQEYGDKLAIKLSREINIEKDEANRILGELNSYEGISDEKLEEEKERLDQSSKILEITKAKQTEIEERYKQGEAIWKMQNELQAYKMRSSELEAQSDVMQAKEQKIKQGESAAKVYPFLERYEKTRLELQENDNEHKKLDNEQKELGLKQKATEEAYQKASEEKEKYLPAFQNKEIQLEETLNEANRLMELENFIQKVQAGLQSVVRNINEYSDRDKELIAKIEQLNVEITQLQEVEKLYKVEESIRTKVQEGLKLTQLCMVNQKNLDKDILSYEESMAVEKTLEQEIAKRKNTLTQKKKELEAYLELQKTYLENVPITRESLLEKQEQLALAKEKFKRLEKLKLEEQDSSNKLQEYKVRKQKLEESYKTLKLELDTTREAYDKAKLENLVHLLRANLQENNKCPVCGSTSHHLENLKQVDDKTLDTLSLKEKEIEEKCKAEEKCLNELQMKQGAEEVQLKRLQDEVKPLENLFEVQTLEEQEKAFEELTKALNEYEERKAELEKNAIALKEAMLKLEAEVGQEETKYTQNQSQLEKLSLEIKKQQKELASTKEVLEEIMKEVKTTDFEVMSQEIMEKDRKREETATLINTKSKIREQLVKDKDENKKHLNERQIKLGSGVAKYDESQKQKQELLISLRKRLQVILKLEINQYEEVKKNTEDIIVFLKTQEVLNALLKGKCSYQSVIQIEEMDASREEEHLQSITPDRLKQWFEAYPIIGEDVLTLLGKLTTLIQTTRLAITKIEDGFLIIKEQKEKIDIQYEKLNKLLVEVTVKLEEITKRITMEQGQLGNMLREENLTEEEVKVYLLTKEEIEILKQTINQYKEEKSKLVGSIEAIEGKLGNERIEETQWISLQEEKQKITKEVEECTKIHINLVTLVKQIEEALVKLGELRDKKKKIDHKLAILGDLDKLFKGKKFVEFVAITRLKYVSIEASRKLKEITNGVYGLEVDEDGKFIIRDYKNGGAQRDASTLSGGETFLASLALALALSSEIQLKGTAPLELFFLDEGFGTLDDDLLEVVMSSLEKIHHERLKVGIISHVEAIKNRVPVKLTLTPAEAGRGGTKVKLERS